ncbi:MAG: PKD-like domain-containing protein, partial [Mucinivorans sp.]
MMKKLSLILLLVVALFACKKNSNPLPSPIITGFDMVASDTTIAMGNTINFAPKTNNNEGNGYLWQLNDKSVATTANY